jgi:hypothetical protein
MPRSAVPSKSGWRSRWVLAWHVAARPATASGRGTHRAFGGRPGCRQRPAPAAGTRSLVSVVSRPTKHVQRIERSAAARRRGVDWPSLADHRCGLDPGGALLQETRRQAKPRSRLNVSDNFVVHSDGYIAYRSTVLLSLRLHGRCQDHPAGVVRHTAHREAAGESERRQFVIVDDRGFERL